MMKLTFVPVELQLTFLM